MLAQVACFVLILHQATVKSSENVVPADTNCSVFDYVVVGSGAGGGSVASLLAQASQNVLLLEAGPDDSAIACTACSPDGQDVVAGSSSLADWYLLIAGMDDLEWPESSNAFIYERPYSPYTNTRSANLLRARMLGGCTSHNFLVWSRGSPRDFDYVEQVLGVEGWGYESVLPFFKQIETYMSFVDHNDTTRGTDGPIKVRKHPLVDAKVQACLEAGVAAGFEMNNNYNGYNQSGTSLIDHNLGEYPSGGRGIFNSRFYRSAISEEYIRPTLKSHAEFLTVRTGCEVSRVLFDASDSETPVAIGVEYRRFNVSTGLYTVDRVYARKEVILSAGVYQTPKILMQSGVGPRDQLDKFKIPLVHESPRIGKEYQNHAYSVTMYQVSEELYKKELNESTATPSLRSDLPRVDDIPPNAMQIITSSGTFYRLGYDYNDIRIECLMEGWLFGDLDYYNISRTYRLWNGDERKFNLTFTDDIKTMNKKKNSMKYITCMNDPQIYSKGRIELGSDDPFHWPLVYPNHLTDWRDVEQHMTSLKIARKVFETKPDVFIREILPGPGVQTDEQLREYVHRTAFDASHAVGTVKMGKYESDPVDFECRVRGVSSLRVVDASIWPISTIAGNNAVTFMIGAKCSHHILTNAASRG